MLTTVFHRPVRLYTAALCFIGTGLCVLAAVQSFRRVGVGSGLVYLLVGSVLVAAAIGIVRGNRWVLTGAAIVLGGQCAAVVGTTWELSTTIAESKARQLRELGIDPTVGITINLIYSVSAFALFCWLAIRWRQDHIHRRGTR